MYGDRPITRREDDRLGFSPVADHLARAILDLPASEGFVFGIEGKWGTGKSTLINLASETLKGHIEPPEIIDFAPWLVGERDELLSALFDELAAAAVRIDPVDDAINTDEAGDHLHKLKRKEELKRALGEKLQTFGRLAGLVGKIAKVASVASVPAAELVSNLAERSSEAAKQFAGGLSVSKRKAELVAALKQLSRRIVVFVDDLDRLEPREASEVLRLIRAVADFPNVVYVLSFDPEVLANTLTKSIQVEDGAAYLEKIVQVSFRVPQPEAFDLRRWFSTKVREMFARELTNEDATLDEQRMAQVIDLQGGRYLKTGRDVVRTLNALQLHAVPVRAHIDIADIVWLQLVRIGNPALYHWTEEYVTELAAVAGGSARLSDGAASEMESRLLDILSGAKLDVEHALMELAEILPGIDGIGAGMAVAGRRRVFHGLNTNAINQFVAAKRLGSPHHYRYYFAFSQPAATVSDEQLQLVIDAASQVPSEAARMLRDLARQGRPQGGTMGEVLLDRLLSRPDQIPEPAILGILSALASTMDDVALMTKPGDFGEHSIWRTARRAVLTLLRRTTGDLRQACVTALFVDGRAIGWLTDILRGEIFAHGYYGDRAQPETEWLLTAIEFREVLVAMLDRYRATPVPALMRVPQFLSLLYAWRQGGDPEEVRQWVREATTSDTGLLLFLSSIRGWRAANGHVYYPLRQMDLESFLNVDDALHRLEAVSNSADASEEHRKLASDLLKAVEQGRER